MYPGHERPLSDFGDPPGPFERLPQDFLYALQQCKLHHTLPCREGLLWFFFHHTATKLLSHLLGISTIQIQLLGYLLVGQIQPHKIKTQHPNFEGLMVAGKNGAGQVIEAFQAIFAFIALLGRLFIVETSFNDVLGITKRTLSSFGPPQLAYGFITLNIIYQGGYVYLHKLKSFSNRLDGLTLLPLHDPKTQHEPKYIIQSCLSLDPSSALRQAMNIPICTAYRALNTGQHPMQFLDIYYFPRPLKEIRAS
jgi:hypothetical protein